MNFQKRTLIKTLFIALILFIIPTFSQSPATASENEYIELAMPTEFIPAKHSDGSVIYITEQEIEKEFQRQSRNFKGLFWNKDIKKFIVPHRIWIRNLTDFYLYFLKKNKIRGKAESWDCENYSSLLNSFATLRIWRAGYTETRGAIGWLRVDAKKEWAGLPPVMHALIFAMTNEGLVIIEPQNGQKILLKDYPNKHYIQEVFLF